MALDPGHVHWIPEELLVLIAKKLPLRSRRSLACVSSHHNKTIKKWRDTKYGPIWLTDDQEILIENVLQCPKGIVHLKAPPSTGKTAIALVSALGSGGFVGRGEMLFIAVAPNLSGVWYKEIEKMFPSKKVLKVGSGGVLYSEGEKRCERPQLQNRPYDIVIGSPTWILDYLGQDNNRVKNDATRTNVPIQWLIVDEAHRGGNTNIIAMKAAVGAYPLLKFMILLTANVIEEKSLGSTQRVDYFDTHKNSYEHWLEYRRSPLRRTIEVAALESSSVPTCIVHYDGASWVTDICSASIEAKLDEYIMDTVATLIPGAKNIITTPKRNVLEMLFRLVVFCTQKVAVKNKDNYRIVCFVPSAIGITIKVAEKLPRLLGYKMYVGRGGSKTITTVDDFNGSTGKSILFLTYKSGATGFSINGDEVFLIESFQCTMAYTYQAAKRLERITNTRKEIHVHYIAEHYLLAIFSRHAAELDTRGIKVEKNVWMVEDYPTLVERFEMMQINPRECSAAIFLYVCCPQSKSSTTTRYVRENLPDGMYERYYKVFR